MGAIPSLSLPNKSKRSNRVFYWLPITILLLLSILFFRTLALSPPYSYLINGSFVLLFVFSIVGLIYVDYYYDIYKQRRKLLQDYTSPPQLDALNEILNSLNSIQVNEIQELMQRVQSILEESLRQKDVLVSLLYRETPDLITSFPALKTEPFQSIPLSDAIKQCAEKAGSTGYAHTAFPLTDLQNDVCWILSLPIKVNPQRTFLVLNTVGLHELKNPERLEQTANSLFKYGVLIGTLILELARVMEQKHEP